MYSIVTSLLGLSCFWALLFFIGRVSPNWRRGQRSLLIIAHPDDESLFFANYLANAIDAGVQVHVLCLTTGNADGLGPIRSQELVKACALFKIPRERITILDDPAFQDGFHAWDVRTVARHVAAAVNSVQPCEVVTFDAGGVSGHPNHTSIYHAVRHLMEAPDAGGSTDWSDAANERNPHSRQDGHRTPRRCRVLALVTHPLAVKFCGPLGAVVALALLPGSGRDLLLPSRNPLRVFRAMFAHWSQLVWYRLLFMVASTYTYANQLRPIGELVLQRGGGTFQALPAIN